MIQAAAELLGDDDMSHWIAEHPYLFMILMIYTVTSVNQAITKIAEYKYSYREDDV